MGIKAGLWALALGTAMVCAGGAQAATWNLPLWGVYSGSFEIEGTITEPTEITFKSTTWFSGAEVWCPACYSSEHAGYTFIGVRDGAGFEFAQDRSYTIGDDWTVENPVSNIYPSETVTQTNTLLVTATMRTIDHWWMGYLAKNGTWTGVQFLLTLPDHLFPSIGTLVVSQEPLATPLPGALPLMVSVLGIGGWLGYRRKRTQRKAVAAAA